MATLGTCTYCGKPASQTCQMCGTAICRDHAADENPQVCVSCAKGGTMGGTYNA